LDAFSSDERRSLAVGVNLFLGMPNCTCAGFVGSVGDEIPRHAVEDMCVGGSELMALSMCLVECWVFSAVVVVVFVVFVVSSMQIVSSRVNRLVVPVSTLAMCRTCARSPR
jgi:hypothetical protein